MTGLHKTANKVIPKENWLLRANPAAKKINEENMRTHESLNARMNPERPPEEAPIPMPDEEEIKRAKRRGQTARGGGRASTILTGGDQERLGG
jgi:hypothetical protein